MAPDTTIIVIGMLKGGSGKTTTAMFSALTLARHGRSVRVIDGDPVSQSAFDWSSLVNHAAENGDETPLPFQVERYPFPDIADHLTALRDDPDVDVVIVDAGGGAASYLEDAVSAADLLIITLAPSAADARRVAATFVAAERGADRSRRPDGVSAVVTLVRSDRRTSQPAAWRAQLVEDGHGEILTKTEIGDLVLYSDAYGHTPKTVGEYEALLTEVGVLGAVPA